MSRPASFKHFKTSLAVIRLEVMLCGRFRFSLPKALRLKPESQGISRRVQLCFILFGRMDHVGTFAIGASDALSEVP
jgi:hypothetical protein